MKIVSLKKMKSMEDKNQVVKIINNIRDINLKPLKLNDFNFSQKIMTNLNDFIKVKLFGEAPKENIL